MKLGVMQPYFFPYIGYFELINRCDKWVVFDTVQYIRRGWMNRNRVIHPTNKEWLYLTAPVQKHNQEELITNVEVVPENQWKDLIIRQLIHYKKWGRYYNETVELVQKALEPDEPSLSRLNVHALQVFCDYIGIAFDYEYASQMNLALGEVANPGEWGLRYSEAMGATQYINPPGGASFLDSQKYRSVGTELVIQKLVEFPYACRHFDYVPGLSIIDVCMWNAPEQIKTFLDGYTYEANAA